MELLWRAGHVAFILMLLLAGECVYAQSLSEEFQRASQRVPGDPARQGGNTKNTQPSAEPPHVINITLPQDSAEQQAAERKDRQREIEIQNSMAESTRSLDASTRALVVVGVVQVLGLFVSLIITNKAADAATRAAVVADQSLTLFKRARLTATNWKLVDFEIGKKPAIAYRIVNRGASHASLVNANFNLRAAPSLDHPTPQYGSIMNDEGGTPVYPDVQFNRSFQVSATPLTEAQYSQVANGTLKLWFFGYYTYRDVFDKTHKFGFLVTNDPASPTGGTMCVEQRAGYNYSD